MAQAEDFTMMVKMRCKNPKCSFTALARGPHAAGEHRTDSGDVHTLVPEYSELQKRRWRHEHDDRYRRVK